MSALAGTPSLSPRLAGAWPLLAILAISAVVHFAWYSRPLTVVFDEVYFPRYGLDYLKNEYFFDLHPPLGKLIYFVTAWVAGLNPDFTFATNQLPFPDPSYLALRIPPRVAGMLLPLVLVAIALELGVSRWAALVVGALTALDNALLVISRFALIDPFLLLFGFSALWCYLHGRTRGWRWLSAAALLAAAALSIKWTGLSFVALILLAEGFAWLRTKQLRTLARIATVVVITVVVYVGCFSAHFALLWRTAPDSGAMSPQFQATLAGNPHAADATLQRPGFVGKFVELHARMFHNTRTTTGPHPYASKWYEWPFMGRSIDFWAEEKDGRIAHIYFLGNPIVWWASGYAILFLLVNLPPRLLNLTRLRTGPPPGRTELMIAIAYLANMLPFLAIARIMFSYHYLPALCVALVGLGYLLDRCGRLARPLGIGLMVLAVLGFLFIAPLSYGLPLPPASFDVRFLVPGWR